MTFSVNATNQVFHGDFPPVAVGGDLWQSFKGENIM